jgi:hypothetical protein
MFRSFSLSNLDEQSSQPVQKRKEQYESSHAVQYQVPPAQDHKQYYHQHYSPQHSRDSNLSRSPPQHDYHYSSSPSYIHTPREDIGALYLSPISSAGASGQTQMCQLSEPFIGSQQGVLTLPSIRELLVFTPSLKRDRATYESEINKFQSPPKIRRSYAEPISNSSQSSEETTYHYREEEKYPNNRGYPDNRGSWK